MFHLAHSLLVGCSSPDVSKDFEAARAAAEATPPALDADWRPEGVVRLSPPLVTELLEQGAQGELDELGGLALKVGSATPTFEVESVELDDGDCAGCIEVKAKIAGEVALQVGPVKTRVPWNGTATVDVGFETSEAGDGRHVLMTVATVKKLKLSHEKSRVNLSEPLEAWSGELLGRVEPMDLGAYGGEDLHLRDIRIEPAGAGLDVVFATDVPNAGTLGSLGEAPDDGWVVRVDERSLLAYARREAFAAGPMDYDVWAEPTSLSLEGHRFEMGLRLWRMAEDSSWWRDYAVQGDLETRGSMLSLTATGVEGLQNSKGAEAIDALAFVTEAAAMPVLLDAAHETVPARSRVTAGSIGMTSTLDDAYGDEGALVLVGSSNVGPAEKKKISR